MEFIKYNIYVVIPKRYVQQALDTINELYSIREMKYYSEIQVNKVQLKRMNLHSIYDIETWEQARQCLFYPNQTENPYYECGWTNLTEALYEWNLVTKNYLSDINVFYTSSSGNFIIDGPYYGKLQDQAFILELLAPFCRDYKIYIDDSNNQMYQWEVKNGEFEETEIISVKQQLYLNDYDLYYEESEESEKTESIK